MRLEELLAGVLNRRFVVGDPFLTDVLVHLLLHEVLFVLQVRSGALIGVGKRGRPRRLPIVEPVVFHVNLNFLGLARRAN